MNSTNNRIKRPHSIDQSKRSPAKRQFRNENEKRRRDLFSQLIINLEEILNIETKPPSNDKTNKSNKATILRQATLFLKKHQNNLTIETNVMLSNANDRSNDIVGFCWKPPSDVVTVDEWLQIGIESMNCFFLVTKSDPHNGQIVHVSKNINSLLDYSQDELLNRSLFELILPRDHDRLRDYLLKDHKVLEKCDLSWRRATADGYEQCTITGAFRQINRENDEKYLMSIVKVNTLDRTLILNNSYSLHEFTTRLNLQGRFIYIDSKAKEFLGYSAHELIGHTYFDFVHPNDLPIIIRAHQIWKQNGNGKSDPYRFLSKGQQWVYLITHCQVQINSWTGKPESYLCTTNSIENSNDCLQKQLLSTTSQLATSSIESPRTTMSMFPSSPERRNCSSDSQITSFLFHLEDEIYRKNILEKLNERRIRKQAEIDVREEEIKVIEDILQFINEYQSKLSSSLIPSSSTHQQQSQTNTNILEEENLYQLSRFERNCDPILLRSPLTDSIEDFSPQSSPITSDHKKVEIIIDPLVSSLFSPCQQEVFNLSSPMTPFSIPSRPSPLSVCSASSSPLTSSISPSTNNSTNEMNHLISSTTTQNIISTEQSNKKSSFNRSLPHSLVS